MGSPTLAERLQLADPRQSAAQIIADLARLEEAPVDDDDLLFRLAHHYGLDVYDAQTVTCLPAEQRAARLHELLDRRRVLG